LFADDTHVRQFGLHSPHNTGQALSIAQLLQRTPFPVDIGPLQHDEIDLGEALPARCVRQGIWLSSSNDGLPFAVVFDQGMQIGMPLGVHVEIAVPNGDKGLEFSQTFFRELEKRLPPGGRTEAR
jgi:hypothetical protein